MLHYIAPNNPLGKHCDCKQHDAGAGPCNATPKPVSATGHPTNFPALARSLKRKILLSPYRYI